MRQNNDPSCCNDAANSPCDRRGLWIGPGDGGSDRAYMHGMARRKSIVGLARPSAPCAKLNRPVPLVRSAMTIVNTDTIAPVIPSNACIAIINQGSDVNVKSSARVASMAKPTSNSGLHSGGSVPNKRHKGK